MKAVASLAAVLAASALAGCGGDGRLSTSDLRQQAGDICAREKKDTARVPTPTAARQIPRFLAGGTAAVAPRLAELERLKAPTSLEPVYRSTVDLVRRQQRAALAALALTRRGGDPVTALQSLAGETTPLARDEDRAWRVLRIPQCVGR